MGKFEPIAKIPLEDVNSKYWVYQSAKHNLQERHFLPPTAPSLSTNMGEQIYTGQIPSDLTPLTDDQLHILMAQLTGWLGYVHYQLAEDETNLSSAMEALEGTEAYLRLAAKYDEHGKKRTEQERKDLMRLDPRYADARAVTLEIEYRVRCIKAVYKTAERNWNTVSRRITQRGQDMERERRTSAANFIPPIPTHSYRRP